MSLDKQGILPTAEEQSGFQKLPGAVSCLGNCTHALEPQGVPQVAVQFGFREGQTGPAIALLQ